MTIRDALASAAVAGAGVFASVALGVDALTADAATMPAISHDRLDVTITAPEGLFAGASLTPGSATTAPVELANDGAAAADVHLTAAASNPDGRKLGAQLLITANPAASGSPCTSTTPNAPARMALDGLAVEPAELDGEPLRLAPGERALWCVTVHVPADLPNEYQGSLTNLTIGTRSTQEMR